MSEDWKQTAIRGYQLQGAQWLNDLPSGARGRLLADGLGTGKSRTALAAQRLAYEDGLMENPCGIVFTTASSAHDWLREAQKFWPELKTHLIGSESAYKRKGESDAAFEFRRNGYWKELLTGQHGPALIVSSYEGGDRIDEYITRESILLDKITIDECFTGETLVWTEKGKCRIDCIMPGDYVWAFNGQQMVLREVLATTGRLGTTLEVVFPTHKVKSTANHPYLTMKGWKRAEDLEVGDDVVCVVSGEAGEGEGPSLLREELQRIVEDEPTRIEAAVHRRVEGEDSSGAVGAPSGGAEGAREKVVNANEAEQSDAQRLDAGSSLEVSQSDEAPSGARRQRPDPSQSAREAGSGSGLAHRSDCADQESQRPPLGPEAGYRQHTDKGGRRSGWFFASIAEGTGEGPAEGRLPQGFGLARVQSVERKSSGRDSLTRVVYNLEVAEAHTYVVGPGLIVHNCHNLKKAATSRATSMRGFVARSRGSTLLTGTPISNRPHELWNLLDLCAKNKFGTFWKFANKFFTINQGEKGRPGTVGDVLDADELQEAISPYMMGRTAAEMMGQMPARQRILKLIDAPGAERVSPAKLHLFAKGTGIQDACSNAVQYKLAAAVELAQDIDAPLVMYTYRRKDAEALSKLLTKAKVSNLVATGELTSSARDKVIERWKAGEATALVCTMDAVKESATLTRAAAMVFVDLSWLPGTVLQCEGRIDPARQPENERRPVVYYYLVTKDGPDEVVAESLVHKIEQMSGIAVKNGLADSFGEFLSPLDKRVKAEEIPPAAMLEDLTARLVARANRLADLGML